MLENREQARLVGMDEFITKPLELDRLGKLIRSQLARRTGEAPDAAQPPIPRAVCVVGVCAQDCAQQHLKWVFTWHKLRLAKGGYQPGVNRARLRGGRRQWGRSVTTTLPPTIRGTRGRMRLTMS